MLNKGNTSFGGELRVQPEDFDRKGYDIWNAFPWWVPLSPEFQILRSIIRPLTIFVMNMFVGSKRASEEFLHNNPMFVYWCSFPINGDGTNDACVTVFPKMAPAFAGKKAIDRLTPLRCPCARLRTEFLLPYIRAGVRFAGSLINVNVPAISASFSTSNADEHGLRRVPGLDGLSPAFARAISGVFPKDFSIGTDGACSAGKGGATVSARKFNHGCGHQWALLVGALIVRAISMLVNLSSVDKYSFVGSK